MGEQVAARIKEKREQKLFKIGNRKKEEKRRGLSSAGRAPALQAGGREFESLSLHDGNEQCGQTHLHLSIMQMHVMK